MDNWVDVFYNGLETNIQVTNNGRVQRVFTEWSRYNTKIGEIDCLNKVRKSEGYVTISMKVRGLGNITRYLHQLVASAFLDYQFTVDGKVVHHKSNPLCNCSLNLEVVTNRQNNSIERTDRSGLPVGVSFNKKKQKFQVKIRDGVKNLFLGYFTDVGEASKAYQDKLKEILERC